MFRISVIIILLVLSGFCLAFFDPGFSVGDPIEFSPVAYSRSGEALIARTSGFEGYTRYYPDTSIFLNGKTTGQIISSCISFINENPDIFITGSANLRLSRAEKRLGRWWITFAQIENGIPVLDGRIDFRVFGNGRLAFCGSHIISEFDAQTPVIGDMDAIESAKKAYAKNGISTSASLVYWPDTSPEMAIGRLAWQIDLSGGPAERFRCYISATDGEPLYHYSLINYYDVWGYAYIEYLPKYWDDTLATSEFQYGNLNLNYFIEGGTDRVGQFELSTILSWEMPLKAYLSGTWTDVIDNEGENGVYQAWVTPPAEHFFTFTPEWADTDELNLYYHTTYIHEYYEALDPPMTALDYAVPARAGISHTPENAYWDGYGTNYGSGGMSTRNFALFSNIIYHEYTHGITGWLYEGTHFPYSGQPGAMNEAFSDYFACTQSDDPRVGYKCQRTGPQMFRNMDNNLQYPMDWYGEVHQDGRIIGGAFWDLRERVGAAVADTLIHFTRYATPNTFDGFVPECIFTDDDDDDLTNGTPHYFEILEAFAIHGIGPGIFPNFIATYEYEDLGDGDGYLEPGEQLSITPHIVADSSFSWPDILGLRAVMTIEAQWTAIPLDTISAFDPTIAPGASDIGDPFVIEAHPDNLPHMANVLITYYADNSPLIVADTFEIYVGHPQVLLVNDDPDSFSQISEFFVDALDLLGVTFVEHKTARMGSPYDLTGFPCMIWFTGNDTLGIAIGVEDTSTISGYLSIGGNVILTGQRMTDQFPGDFLQTHFGAAHLSTGGAVILDGIDAPGLDFAGRNLILMGAPGAGNQHPENLTTLIPTSGDAIFDYTTGTTGAVAFDNGVNRTVVFGFGIEGIGGLTYMQLPELLAEIFDWFGLQFTSVGEDICKPERPGIKIYPNPFNATCRIDFSGMQNRKVKSIVVFDIAGRRVDEIATTPTDSQQIWRPNNCIPSGIYYIQIRTDDGPMIVKTVLMR